MVVFYGHIRRIVFVLASPGVTYVDINRITVSVHFPNTGDFHLSPTFIIIVCPVEVGRSSICIFHPVEFPDAIQGHKVA